ncbi:receptor-interacting serine/threonine-protein kinase 3 isoform X2 [Etheostoma cragini]|uniref:receptor-interacting serine/threonine-protein kinase 3 isoform X2 n=1 Tax=Etheostoma cragini TaxID=417921 RepID=UPI00155EABFA|nr:receptor-interacting serine/threonine-protein kinase 3 isoform X2 [Etheostoma cragini]
MALSSCQAPILVEDSSLKGWKVIGSGGFGQIYKARHCQWGCDVAIKLLHYDDGTSESLLREIDMMRQGSSPYAIQVRGVFRGRVPNSGLSTQLGLVMELMERGSLASLQETLRGAQPWPLVFRLAHQVALGLNFLHSLSPPILHLDLKPSNVLLDSYLNAKLTDFGLARYYHSVTRVSKKDSGEEGGTISYMPPEAFRVSYRPTLASDIYSYGVLLWSIVTGKQPYAYAKSSLVRLRIPEGDRPLLDEIRVQAVGRAGLTGLMELMERCWDTKPEQRPSSLECTTQTEELYKLHKHAINDAVHQVLKILDQRKEETVIEQIGRVHITQALAGERLEAVNVYDNALTGGPPIQEMAGGCTANQTDNARVKDPPSIRPASVCYKSSVCPIGSSLPSPSTGRSTQSRTAKHPQMAYRPNLSSQYHRQFSSPDTFPCHPAPGFQIHLCNITGLQHGNNNTMNIELIDPSDRKRHPTAPSRVDLPPPPPGSWKDKSGGLS